CTCKIVISVSEAPSLPSQRGMLQQCCSNVTSATLNIAGNVAATFLQHSCNVPMSASLQRLESCRNVARNIAGTLQECCRNIAGMFRTLQEYCRNVAGMLRECCRNVAGILQTLQEYIEY
ncbi:hypothetical protein PV325_011067, partial [Microctonus aethiopoides]